MKIKTVILCGGSGTRLWPISRKTSPKQFVPLLDEKSLYQKTIERNEHFSDEILVIVNEKQFPICKEQESRSISQQYFLEPIGRNTAPAIALACLASDPEDILMIVPSDHLINNQKAYKDSVMIAQQMAQDGNLVTFGIHAKYPETGYGYIEADGNNVVAFKEKPDQKTATQYVQSGNYYWNSGMFCFKAGIYLAELEKYAPQIFEKTKEVFNNQSIDNDQPNKVLSFKLDLMRQVPDDSIDYAVMEKSEKVKVVKATFDWSDMGSFDSLYEDIAKDTNGNSKNHEHISYQSKNNLILSDQTSDSFKGKKLIATFDVEDLIIVDTKDALLIGRRGKSQDVKKIVDILKQNESPLLE